MDENVISIYQNQAKLGCRQAETNQILKIEALVLAKWIIKHFAFFLLTRYILVICDMFTKIFRKKCLGCENFGIKSSGA